MQRLILLLLFLPFASSRGAGGDDAVPQISVTYTWGDLFAHRPLTVESDKVIFPNAKPVTPGQPSPVSVWVGIDRDHSTRDGGVLLYCAAKGAAFSAASEEELGPFYVIVQTPVQLTQAQNEWQMPSNADFRDSTFTLCAFSFALGAPGKYVIELVQRFNPDPKAPPKIVAKVTIQVSGQTLLPWSPWGASKKEELRWPPQGGNIAGMTDAYTSMTVSNPVGDIAIPEARREFISYPAAPDGNTPLPQLIPDQPDPETHLKIVGNNLIVTTGQDMDVYFPDDHFLTRWWVNDKPFVPDPNAVDTERPTVRSLAARTWDVKAVHFELDFRPERLKAHKGDTIGVQVLFCPAGWQQCGNPVDATPAFAIPPRKAGPRPASFSFPSNRVDFIYSGDPKNFARQ